MIKQGMVFIFCWLYRMTFGVNLFCSRGEGVKMLNTVSHDRSDESLESKARWFQSLSLLERMDMLCFFTDLILENNPKIVEKKNDQPTWGSFRVLSKTQS